MSTEALTTSEIEGEILDRASVQSSIRKELGLAADKRRPKPSEQGIAEMMVDSYRRFSEPLSNEMLFRWHHMLVRGRDDLRDVGRYRTGDEPMQVVSGAMYEPRVHFEAPPSSAMRREMKTFVRWFNHTAPGGDTLPTLTRAGIAHLYFVSIHPFEDGNGRIGRAVAEKALSESLGQPTLIALAATILAKRKAYYDALEAANKNNEITAWLSWFAATAIEAQRRTIVRVEFLIDKTRLLDRLRGQLNDRQEKALQRMLREGPDGFKAVSAPATMPPSPVHHRQRPRAISWIWSRKARSYAWESVVTRAIPSRFPRRPLADSEQGLGTGTFFCDGRKTFVATERRQLILRKFCWQRPLRRMTMHLTARRVFQLALGLIAASAPVFCGPSGPCVGVVTPEPSYFWVMGAGAGAILLLRRLRSKK
jgi:Fic family protein